MAESSIKKGSINQIGIRVRDLDKVVKEWEAFFGIKAYYGESDAYEVTGATYRGEPCRARIRQAFLDFDNVQIEFISPVDEIPSAWSEGMEITGEGLHHLAFKTDDMKEALKEFREHGFEALQSGHWEGDTPGSYGYVDSQEKMKSVIELLQY